MPAQAQLIAFDDSLDFGQVGVGIASGGAVSQVAFRSFSAIPEPATGGIAALAMASLGGFVLLRRRSID